MVSESRRATATATAQLSSAPSSSSPGCPDAYTYTVDPVLETAQDNPVGVGYSYVEDDSLLVTTDWQQAADATTLLKALVREVPTLQSPTAASTPPSSEPPSPGPSAPASSASRSEVTQDPDPLDEPISVGKQLSCAIEISRFAFPTGVALGDSWISPEDFTVST